MNDLRLRQAESSATASSSALEEIWAEVFAQLQAQASESSVSGAGSGVSSSAVGEATGSVSSVPLWRTTTQTVFETTTASVTVSAEPVTISPTPSETSTQSSASTTSQDTSTSTRSSSPTASSSTASSSTASSRTASSSTTISATSSPTPSRSLFTLETSSTASSTTTYAPVPPGVLSFDPLSSSSGPASDTSFESGPMPTMPADNASSGSGGLSASSKRAIVGSLAGAIGGLILIGLLMCAFLRRRHKREEEAEAPKDELKDPKPPRYHMVRKWSDFTLRSTPEIVPGSQPSAPDDTVIRVSTDHWKRPFAKDEAPQESPGPVSLRLVNPNNTRSSSPKFPSSGKDQRKVHPALRAFNHVRSRTTSRSALPQFKPGPIAQPQPVYVNDPQKSRAAAIASIKPVQPHSSKSSSSTQAIVRPQPLEDPFISSARKSHRISPQSSNRTSPPSSGRPRRPSLQRLRTSMTQLNNSINPFNSKVIPSRSIPPFQGYVAPELSFWDPQRESQGSTYSVSPPQYVPTMNKVEELPARGSAHVPKKSDPFDLLISPSTRDNGASSLPARAREDERALQGKTSSSQTSSPPNWVAYEGT